MTATRSRRSLSSLVDAKMKFAFRLGATRRDARSALLAIVCSIIKTIISHESFRRAVRVLKALRTFFLGVDINRCVNY